MEVAKITLMEVVQHRQPARRTGGRSARVRSAVLDSTLIALLSHGLDDLSITEIAQRAGVHPTSIYRRWGSKSNLVLDAVLSQTAVEIPTPDTGSLRGDLLALMRSIATFLRTPLGELLVRAALWHELPEFEAARGGYWVERFRMGVALLESSRDRGELRPDVDPLLALEALVGPLHLRVVLTREPIDDEFIEKCVDVVLEGIATAHR